MDVTIAITVWLVIPNSCASCSDAGAIIEDVTGLTKLNDDMAMVAAHLFLNDQFRGFSGSSGPSQSTMSTPKSTSTSVRHVSLVS